MRIIGLEQLENAVRNNEQNDSGNGEQSSEGGADSLAPSTSRD